MTSGTITTATIFVWMINILMVFSQFAMNDMSANTGPQFINCSGTIIKTYSTNGDCSSLTGVQSKNLSLELPTGSVPNSGFFIVDWITSASSWIGKQIDMFTQVVNAPYNLLKNIPIFQNPAYSPFAAVIGIMWWAISLLLIVAFIFGR
jgi:hypothetical protein